MKYLLNCPPFLFFTGKGGVGKTSLACATAIHLAGQGRKVLLVSTDPASNIAQVFQQTIGNTITPIARVSGLFGLEINPQEAAEQYRKRVVDPVRGLLPEDVISGIEEQLSGACTTEIAAFDEFTALLTDPALRQSYDHIVFDTAPTGHTIRMLQLPGAWSSFLETSPEGASCLGPLAGLEKQKSQYSDAVAALADTQLTRMVLVARAQASTLREVSRTYNELSALGIKQHYLVINGILPEEEAKEDALAQAVYRREQTALASIPNNLISLPIDKISLKPFNLFGVDALRQMLTPVSSSHDGSKIPLPARIEVPSLSAMVDGLAETDHGLIMLMGKGGVGKTTLAAAIAVELAKRGFPVHLSTSDPAAHLAETLHGSVENLTVSRIDPQAETERYRQHILNQQASKLDAQGKAMLEEDLRSPCTEEIAVFQAFSRLIRDAGKKFVVMDTAPTGHTLLLLDATGAYHREIARQMGKNTHFTTPMMQLQNPDQTKILIVTLPETTPVLEAAHLQEDLQRAGITPWGWIINNSLTNSQTSSLLLRQRAEQERPQIEAVTQFHAKRTALVSLQAEEPVGVERLLKLAES